jgi:hypothetical protein
MAKFKLWKDILTERDVDGTKMYSQGRIYLLWAIIAYYITLGVISYKAFTHKDIEDDSLKTIIDALQWVLGLMAGYVFGGKGIEALKVVFGKGNNSTTSQQAPPEEGKI